MLKTISKVLIPFLILSGLFVLASQPVSAAYQTKYVENGLTWVDYGDNDGSIAYPYLTINEALDDMDTDGGIIYVAEGSYSEDIDLHDLDNITIIGGYNKGPGDYSVYDPENQQTILDGVVTGTNISGSIEGFTFGGQSGVDSLVYINLSGSGYDFALDGNYFTLASVNYYMARVDAGPGSTATIANNVFTLVSSSQSIVESQGAGSSVIEKNHFNAATSSDGSYGIIRATNGAVVKNNLIQNSGSSNRVAIRITNEAEVYNNTVVDGTASSGAIASSGSGHTVYNNLVSNVSGNDFVLSPSATESNNFGEGDCDPDFAGGSGEAAYKLGSASTCIDAGRTVSGVTKDYFGTSRPSGGGYDVGFHEFYVAQACGNSFVEGAEECDDGNTTNGDGCSSTCQTETTPGPAVCGNGTVETGEDCDDGNTTNGDGCSATCDTETQVACGSWGDINSTDSHYSIAVYLCNHGGIIQGDSYGNLRIDDLLTRAELLAMAFRAREYENLGAVDVNAEACFNDVVDDWYAKYFCTAKDEGFIEGYAGNVAKPGNIVILAEGLKMFLGALDKYYSIDSGDCWYCSMIWSAEPHDWLPFTFNSPTDIGPDQLSRRYAMDMLYRIMTN